MAENFDVSYISIKFFKWEEMAPTEITINK